MIETSHYHLVGVAGAGMNALAQVLLAEGCAVSGSDRYCDQEFRLRHPGYAGRRRRLWRATGGQRSELEIIRKLCVVGVRFVPQDGSGITEKTRGIVVSTAIENDNLDILAANRLNVPVIHRAAMLADLVADKRCVAVTGTSGKTTVTGMIGWVLEQMGANPVIVNGGIVLNWCDEETIGNVRYPNAADFGNKEVGSKAKGISNIEYRISNIEQGMRERDRKLWVIEADESDRSLLKFHPDWAVITNVSKDHFEVPEAIDLFRTFSKQVSMGLVSALDKPDFLRNFNVEVSKAGSDFVYQGVRFHVSLLGRHNAENALLAIVLCERLGFHLERVSRALASFKGIQRRLEIIGTARGVTVIDDYAHNPAKIRAAWQAVAPYYRRVLAVWRPHGFGPLRMMMDELVEVFGELCGPSDRIYILPVYEAGGTADRSVRSEMLVENLRACNIPAMVIYDGGELAHRITETAEGGDVVLTMGARDPALSGLARKIFTAVSVSNRGQTLK